MLPEIMWMLCLRAQILKLPASMLMGISKHIKKVILPLPQELKTKQLSGNFKFLKTLLLLWKSAIIMMGSLFGPVMWLLLKLWQKPVKVK